ncbi:hypothetical protein QOT17_020377 [Balamuthia mandrillaris]
MLRGIKHGQEGTLGSDSGKVAAPQPTAELVEGEAHSKKFTFCGRVVALSSVEGTTGKGDIAAGHREQAVSRAQALTPYWEKHRA